MSNRTRWIGVAAAIALLPALVYGGRPAQAFTQVGLCWRSLAPDTGDQNLSAARTEPILTSIGAGEAWIGWQEDGQAILRWVMGRWTSAPALLRPGVNGLWPEVMAASPSGRVVVAATANRDDGTSELHIGRASGGKWEWLGAPLISSREPFTHAHRPSIAFVGERPVVAWSEERNTELGGLFVARWNGSSWTRLATLDPGSDDSFLSPAVAVDGDRRVWLAWNRPNGGVRVARWDGSAWRDVGRDTLEKVAATQGEAASRELSLAVDKKGHVWLLRLVSRQPTGAGLALARWDGTNWAAVPEPRGPAGRDSTVWSASMIFRGDAALVGWSQSHASDNHYLYVSESAPGDRWTARLSGLHLADGVSNVTDVRLATGDTGSFFVSWDEPGKDKRRTRLVQAYSCAAGETPAAPPKSEVERDTWPTTVNEAARRIVAALDDESKARVRASPIPIRNPKRRVAERAP